MRTPALGSDTNGRRPDTTASSSTLSSRPASETTSPNCTRSSTMTPLNGCVGSSGIDNGSTEITPPPAATRAPATVTAVSSSPKVRSRSVMSAPASRLATRSRWFGAVIRGARLVKSISPVSPFTGPAGLVKSRFGITSRPLLVPSSGVSVQPKRPSKRTEPVTGDCTKASSSGVSVCGCSPFSAKVSSGALISSPPVRVAPSCWKVSRPIE